MSENDKNEMENENPQGEEQRNIFDHIGDWFKKMLIGIFIFVFQKLPVRLWKIISDFERLKKYFKYLYSIIRAVVLGLLVFIIICLGWIVFWYEKFIAFWQYCWEKIMDFFSYVLMLIRLNAGWIWMVLTICGCIYGLLYVTLKRRAQRQGKAFNGLFGWLRKNKKTDEVPQLEKGEIPQLEEKNSDSGTEK